MTVVPVSIKQKLYFFVASIFYFIDINYRNLCMTQQCLELVSNLILIPFQLCGGFRSLSLLTQVFSPYNATKSEKESFRLFLQKDSDMIVDEPHRGMLVPIPSFPRLLLV
jgi:hypothetical protein